MDLKNAKYFAQKNFSESTVAERPYKKREDFLTRYRAEKEKNQMFFPESKSSINLIYEEKTPTFKNL